MPPKLAEILGLENPFPDDGTKVFLLSQGKYFTLGDAYDRALEEAWAKLEAVRVSGRETGTVRYAVPGWLLWIPDAGDELADQDSLEAQEMFECVG